MIAAILSNIVSFVAVVLMFIIVKEGYEQKDRMLRLFQFGYLGLLIFGWLGHSISCLEQVLQVAIPHHWRILKYMTDVLNLSVLIPYLMYNRKKSKDVVVS